MKNTVSNTPRNVCVYLNGKPLNNVFECNVKNGTAQINRGIIHKHGKRLLRKTLYGNIEFRQVRS